MTRVKSELMDVASQLGDASEEEYTFLLVPVAVYSAVSQQARVEGCSVGEVFQKALMQYLRAADQAMRAQAEQAKPARPEPELVVTRRRR